MVPLMRKISYKNNQKANRQGSRSVKVRTMIECSNTGKATLLKDLIVQVRFTNPFNQIQKYNVQLEGVEQLFASTVELENGIEPFRAFSIHKIPINNFHNSSSDSIKLSKCLIKITPISNEKNKDSRSEKLFFLQSLLEAFDLRFEKFLNLITISGTQKVENYQTFIRHLVYKNDKNLIQNKKFSIVCFQSEVNMQTNRLLIQLNLIKNYLKQKIFDIKIRSEKLAKPLNFTIENVKNNIKNSSKKI
jgi:hypothetical protein